MDSREKLGKNIEFLIFSDHVFKPSLMKGLVFANLKSTNNIDDNETSRGVQIFTSMMVASLYNCKMSSEVVVTDEMVDKFFANDLKASDLGRFAYHIIECIDDIAEGETDEFMQGYLSTMAADLEIAVSEIEREELI